jgi:diguanylate cyclase (GGDEF)-like protein/PAS domain S-box-containing protein
MSIPEEARHILVIEDPQSKQTVSLKESNYSIGRDPSNAIVLKDRQVSRHHATLLKVTDYQNNKFFYRIIDGTVQGTRSKNGLQINDQSCLSHELKHGDTIRFGKNTKANYYISTAPKTLAKDKETKDYSTPPLVLLDSSPHPIIEIDFDSNITYLNQAAKEQFPDLDKAKRENPLLQGLFAQDENQQTETRVREVSCDNRVFEQFIKIIKTQKKAIIYSFEITKYAPLKSDYKESKEDYKHLFSHLSDGIALVNLETGSILEANAAYSNLLGYALAEVVGLNLDNIFIDNRQEIEQAFAKIISNPAPLIEKIPHTRKDGSLIVLETAIRLITAETPKIAGFVLRNLDSPPIPPAPLPRQLFHDTLTNLANHTLFSQQLAIAIAHAQQYQHPMGLMLLDIDAFKTINEELGHSVGNRLLQSLGKRLNSCVHASDTVARWGNDEFAVLLPQLKNTAATAKLAQSILEALQQPFEIEQQQLSVKISLGIAIYPQDGKDAETLLKNAEAALYRTKKEGGNHYQFYNSTMTAKTSLWLRLESLIGQALEQQQFSLHYQPQFNLKTGKISGMEALLRWQHPDVGTLAPHKFIPLAEKTDLILHIGKWVLKTACEQSLRWQQAGLSTFPIAVNLCAREFQQPRLTAIIASILEETGIAPQCLQLEITEATLRQNWGIARKTLRELRQLGVHITLDDFGRGYSSLGYLKQFSFNSLKLDHALVQELSKEDSAMISALLALGKGFNLKVIAKGVETQQQLDQLRDLQGEEVQGYWFSLPLDADQASEFLKQHLATAMEPT